MIMDQIYRYQIGRVTIDDPALRTPLEASWSTPESLTGTRFRAQSRHRTPFAPTTMHRSQIGLSHLPQVTRVVTFLCFQQ